MSERFIDKIRKVILDHMHDEKFGVRTLASELGFSRSLIFIKVKAATGKTVNQFIKEIRLNESVKLLKEEKYTVAEIAYMTGFSSPQYFNKCFHDYFGCTPGKLKNRQLNVLVPIKRKKSKSILIYSSIALILCVVLVFTFSGYNPWAKDFSSKTSIAVLPFSDLSENSNQGWFVMGVTEEIRLGLSKLNGLRVKKGLTIDQFKVTNRNYREIARDLKVDYLLTGTYRQEFDSLIVTAQLIKSNGVVQRMSVYTGKNEGVLSIQRDIASYLVNELGIILIPEK